MLRLLKLKEPLIANKLQPLNKIPVVLAILNIDIIQMGGNKDLTYEDIWAEINVKGKGRITVFALSRESFKKTPKIVLGKIGDYDIRWEGEGDIEVTNSETENNLPTKEKMDADAKEKAAARDIIGMLVNANDQMVGATVKLSKGDDTAIAEKYFKGNFDLVGIKQGYYRLTVSTDKHVAFETVVHLNEHINMGKIVVK